MQLAAELAQGVGFELLLNQGNDVTPGGIILPDSDGVPDDTSETRKLFGAARHGAALGPGPLVARSDDHRGSEPLDVPRRVDVADHLARNFVLLFRALGQGLVDQARPGRGGPGPLRCLGRESGSGAAGRGRRLHLFVVGGGGAHHLAFRIESLLVSGPRVPIQVGRHPHHGLARSKHLAEHLLGLALQVKFMFALYAKLSAGESTRAAHLLINRKGGPVVVDHRNIGRGESFNAAGDHRLDGTDRGHRQARMAPDRDKHRGGGLGAAGDHQPNGGAHHNDLGFLHGVELADGVRQFVLYRPLVLDLLIEIRSPELRLIKKTPSLSPGGGQLFVGQEQPRRLILAGGNMNRAAPKLIVDLGLLKRRHDFCGRGLVDPPIMQRHPTGPARQEHHRHQAHQQGAGRQQQVDALVETQLLPGRHQPMRRCRESLFHKTQYRTSLAPQTCIRISS